MTDKSEFADVVAAAALQAMTPEKITALVSDRADKLLNDAISEAMSSYGPVGKVIKQAVEDAMQITNLNLPSYNQEVIALLEKKLSGNVAHLLQGTLSDQMDDLLKMAPAEAKLSDLAKDMLEAHYEYDDGYERELITVGIREHDYSTGDSFTVYLDGDDANADESSAEVSMHVYRGEILSVHVADRNVTTGHRFTAKTSARISRGIRNNIADKCLAMYACKTKLTLDMDEVCTSRLYD